MEKDEFNHNCWEWDGLNIGSNSIEIVVCYCFEGLEFEALKDKLREEYTND